MPKQAAKPVKPSPAPKPVKVEEAIAKSKPIEIKKEAAPHTDDESSDEEQEAQEEDSQDLERKTPPPSITFEELYDQMAEMIEEWVDGKALQFVQNGDGEEGLSTFLKLCVWNPTYEDEDDEQ